VAGTGAIQAQPMTYKPMRACTSQGPVPILMYHEVTPRPETSFRRYTVTARAFAPQMNWLATVGYEPITLDDLLDHCDGRGNLRGRPVVITFDDGFRDCIEHAVPVLQARGFTATFYLVAGQLGGTSRWTRQALGIELSLLDAKTAADLEARGFRCGAQSLTHPRLTSLPLSGCWDELALSRRLVEDCLGDEVRDLAYLFGALDECVRAIAAETGYRSACSTRPGLSPVDDDRLALRRVPVYGAVSLVDFACRLRTAHTARDLLRRSLHRKDFPALARDSMARGHTAALFAQKHPDVASNLKLGTYGQASPKWRLVRSLLLGVSRALPWSPACAIAFMKWLERRRPPRLDHYYTLALDYFFWVGARVALRQRQRSGTGRASSAALRTGVTR
jgi:peptidoglycan/xylan/chitin deacetylase (PgdA/CDA1 family)